MFSWMCIFVPMDKVSTESRREHKSHWDFELLCECWELIPEPLQDQLVLLPTELSLELFFLSLLLNFIQLKDTTLFRMGFPTLINTHLQNPSQVCLVVCLVGESRYGPYLPPQYTLYKLETQAYLSFLNQYFSFLVPIDLWSFHNTKCTHFNFLKSHSL